MWQPRIPVRFVEYLLRDILRRRWCCVGSTRINYVGREPLAANELLDFTRKQGLKIRLSRICFVICCCSCRSSKTKSTPMLAADLGAVRSGIRREVIITLASNTIVILDDAVVIITSLLIQLLTAPKSAA